MLLLPTEQRNALIRSMDTLQLQQDTKSAAQVKYFFQ